MRKTRLISPRSASKYGRVLARSFRAFRSLVEAMRYMALVIFRVCCTLSIRFLISRVLAISLTALFHGFRLEPRQKFSGQLQDRLPVLIT